jgi:hypothetical protein
MISPYDAGSSAWKQKSQYGQQGSQPTPRPQAPTFSNQAAPNMLSGSDNAYTGSQFPGGIAGPRPMNPGGPRPMGPQGGQPTLSAQAPQQPPSAFPAGYQHPRSGPLRGNQQFTPQPYGGGPVPYPGAPQMPQFYQPGGMAIPQPYAQPVSPYQQQPGYYQGGY